MRSGWILDTRSMQEEVLELCFMSFGSLNFPSMLFIHHLLLLVSSQIATVPGLFRFFSYAYSPILKKHLIFVSRRQWHLKAV